MQWRTPAACYPLADDLKSSACSMQDPETKHIFKLSGLRRHRIQYQDADSEFIISACKPVPFAPDAMCPPGTSICLRKKSEKDPLKK